MVSCRSFVELQLYVEGCAVALPQVGFQQQRTGIAVCRTRATGSQGGNRVFNIAEFG